jgi:hypothetical protein
MRYCGIEMTNLFSGTQNKLAVAHFTVLYQHFPGDIEQNCAEHQLIHPVDLI